MLLQPQEKVLCEQLAAGQPPDSQRASALLAVDTGATHAATAELTGLTLGQVKYWLRKFGKIRMAIFPVELLSQSEPESLSSSQIPDQPTAPEALDLDQPVQKDKVEKKSNGATVAAEPVKKNKAKTKKIAKMTKATKKPKKKKKSKSGKKRKGKKNKNRKKKQGKKGKKKQDKKTSSGKKPKQKKKGKK